MVAIRYALNRKSAYLMATISYIWLNKYMIAYCVRFLKKSSAIRYGRHKIWF